MFRPRTQQAPHFLVRIRVPDDPHLLIARILYFVACHERPRRDATLGRGASGWAACRGHLPTAGSLIGRPGSHLGRRGLPSISSVFSTQKHYDCLKLTNRALSHCVLTPPIITICRSNLPSGRSRARASGRSSAVSSTLSTSTTPAVSSAIGTASAVVREGAGG